VTDGSGRGDSRSRSLRRALATRLVVVALLATALLGGLMFFQTSSLLSDAVETRLENQQRSQARTIGDGLAAVGNTVSVSARGDVVVQAMVDFAAGFAELDEAPDDGLDDAQSEALESYYTGFVADRAAEGGVELPPTEELIPTTPASRYLQYLYVVANPFEREERDQLAIAEGDDSAYGAAHAEHHPRLNALRESFGYDDLLLLDTEGNVLYTSVKRADFARGLESSPALGESLTVDLPQRLAAAPPGEAVFVDFSQYLPALGAPTLFAAAAVVGDQGTVGAVVVEVPIRGLNSLTTADGRWEEIGLGETGEAYVVGRDRLMRSDSRLWLEDPAAYLDAVADAGYPEEVADGIDRFDTTVLIQPVETEPVEAAFDGEEYVGRASDYLGRGTLAVAGLVENDQLDWAIVAQLENAEANDPLGAFISRLLVTAAVLVPLVALAGLFLAGRLTRPFVPIMEASQRIAHGDLDVVVPDLGRNEIGDVARRLTALAAHLKSQEQAIEEEEAATRKLLLSALPPRLVEKMRDSSDGSVDDLVDMATVVAVTVEGVVDAAGVDAETAVELGVRVSAEFEAAADRLDLERVRSSSDQHVFVAGLGSPEAATGPAVRFASDVVQIIEQFSLDTGLEVEFAVGVAAGEVISGLLTSEELAYGVFGDAPQRALALVAVARSGDVLLDGRAIDELGDEASVEVIDDLLDLRGEPLQAARLVLDRSGRAGGGVRDADLSSPRE
jgi:class 3 adenylate cyclase